ncbi:MAG: NAD+ synthase [Acidobacteriota bacterium]|jgi:NAD+ synthase
MKSSYPPAVNIDLALTVIERFLRQELEKTGRQKLVVGLSGGVDSALSCALAVRALGRRRIVALKMPYRTSSPASEQDADTLIAQLGIRAERIDISPMVDSLFKSDEGASDLRRGNFMARVRMACIFDRSALHGALVLGTSNKTELLLGYGTWYGDMASSLNPIGDLYKTQVWQLAGHLDIPRTILEKAPSADLWPNQTDEEEIGIAYEEADAVLYLLVDERYTVEEILGLGFPEDRVRTIMGKVRASQYKRRLPVIAKLSQRTIGIDFRYPRDWGL